MGVIMKYFKIILNILIWVFCLYLVVSAIYICAYIDFSPPKVPQELADMGFAIAVSPGFSSETNIIREIMGLPPTYTTYMGVSPSYLISAVIRIGIAGVLIFFKIKNRKLKKLEDKEE